MQHTGNSHFCRCNQPLMTARRAVKCVAQGVAIATLTKGSRVTWACKYPVVRLECY